MRNKNIIFIIAGLLLLPVMGTIVVQAEEKELSRGEILQRSTEHFRQGEKFYNQGDFARADEEFKKAQKLLDSLQQEQIEVKVKEKGQVNYDGYLKKALEFAKNGESERQFRVT